MNKSNWITLGFAFLAFGLASFSVLSHEKLAYVDSTKLVKEYKGAIEARSAYEQKARQWKANIDTLTNALNEEVEKHEREKKNMTKRELEMSQELIQLKQEQLENYQSIVMQNAGREDKEISTKILGEVNDFITRYGKSHGYRFILGATNAGNIVYADKGNDITDEIIKELNVEFEAGKK